MIYNALLLAGLHVLGALADSSSDFAFYQERGPHEIAHTDRDRHTEMWYPKDPSEPVHCYVFCVGTGANPIDYQATAEHLASHGVLALYAMQRSLYINTFWIVQCHNYEYNFLLSYNALHK